MRNVSGGLSPVGEPGFNFQDKEIKKTESEDHIPSDILKTKIGDNGQNQIEKLATTHKVLISKGLTKLKEKLSYLSDLIKAGNDPIKRAAVEDKQFIKKFLGTANKPVDIKNMSEEKLLKSLQYETTASFPKFLKKLSLEQLETLKNSRKITTIDGHKAVQSAIHEYYCQNAYSLDNKQFDKSYSFYTAFFDKDIHFFKEYLSRLPNDGLKHLSEIHFNTYPSEQYPDLPMSQAILSETKRRT